MHNGVMYACDLRTAWIGPIRTSRSFRDLLTTSQPLSFFPPRLLPSLHPLLLRPISFPAPSRPPTTPPTSGKIPPLGFSPEIAPSPPLLRSVKFIVMAHMKGAANWRNSAAAGGKQAFLPPKSPFPSMSPAYADYGGLNPAPGSKGIPRQRDGQRQHQRTSSESFLEEQPSWLDDLLNEPETPVRRGAHRRSSSDSFAYLDAFHLNSNMDGGLVPEEYNPRSLPGLPSWGCQEFDYCQDNQYASYFTDANAFGKVHSRGREGGLSSGGFPNNGLTLRDKAPHAAMGSSGSTSEPETAKHAVSEKLEQEESGHQDTKASSEEKEGSQAKHQQTEADQKRVKQQFAQRSRVRKLQYIAELERSVQALQAEGSEVSAELQFLDQQNLILSLENKALKQRLDSLAQEQLLKRLQQEMLEREIARLRAVCQQQQQLQQLPPSVPSRSNSRDLDTQFGNLSLKHKEANSGRDTMAGPLRI